jgi:membrane fusion protein, multidrug efflux system
MPRKTLVTYVSLISLLLAGCSSQETPAAKKEMPAIPVIATAAAVKDITIYIDSIGTLQPSVFMEIKPQTNGKLVEVMINEGQTVRKGDPLFLIDTEPYEIKVQEAEAQFAIDQATFNAVKKKLARYKDLAERDLIPKTEWDELKAQLQKAQAVIDLDSARLKSAKLEMQNCLLSSPLDGRIGKLDAVPGFLVASGQSTPLATISQLDPLIVEFTVTEKEFPLIPSDAKEMQIESLCSQGFCNDGTLTFLDNHFDAKTGLMLIRGKVKNPELLLRPGQSVRVKIPVAVTADAKMIPQKAIRYNQQGPYIYVINDDLTVAVRQLVLGKEHGTDQIVLEGIEPEERLILEGHLRLSPGLKVEIKS